MPTQVRCAQEWAHEAVLLTLQPLFAVQELCNKIILTVQQTAVEQSCNMPVCKSDAQQCTLQQTCLKDVCIAV